MTTWALLCLTLAGASPEPVDARAAPASAEARLAEGTAALDALQLEQAAAILEELVAAPGVRDETRARAWLALGLTRASLLDMERAQAAFTAALGIDPRLDVPPDTSPKVRALFERTRAALLPNGVPPRVDASSPSSSRNASSSAPSSSSSSSIAPGASGAAPPPPAGNVAAVGAFSGPSTSSLLYFGGAVLLGAGGLAGLGALAADVALGQPIPGRTRAEYDALRSLGIGALAASAALCASAVVALVGGVVVGAAQ